MADKLDGSTRVRVAPGVYARPFGNETVLLEFGRGEYFALDEIGTEVWSRIEKGASLGQIAAEIAGAYDVSEGTALADIVALVEDMRTRSLIEVVGSSS